MFSTSCVVAEVQLADRGGHVAPLSLRNSILPALNSRTAEVMSVATVPDRGRGHQATGTKQPAERADDAHHVGVAKRDVEVQEPALDLGGEIVAPDDVGAGGRGLLGVVTLGEHGDPNVLADPVRQRDRAADVLVALPGVDPQVGRDLDRLDELRRAEGLELSDRIRREGPGRSVTFSRKCTIAFRLTWQVRAPFRRAAADARLLSICRRAVATRIKALERSRPRGVAGSGIEIRASPSRGFTSLCVGTSVASTASLNP